MIIRKSNRKKTLTTKFIPQYKTTFEEKYDIRTIKNEFLTRMKQNTKQIGDSEEIKTNKDNRMNNIMEGKTTIQRNKVGIVF